MWMLNLLDKDLLQKHYVDPLCDKIFDELEAYKKKRKKKSHGENNFLPERKIPAWLRNRTVLNEILASDPKILISLNHSLITKIPGDREAILALVKYVFDYDKFIVKNPVFSYAVANMKQQKTCSYCNRNYTLTIDCENTETITRPDFDHWFPKSEFPLLALSYYNLIPSCKICNSSIKGRTEFVLDKHVHPYIEEENSEFKFTRHLGKDLKWEIDIEYLDSSKQAKVINTLRDLKILEVYKYHSELELKDIIDFRTSYNSTYLDELFKRTLQKFPSKSREDVYRMLFGAELEKERFLDRPFSKLKHDILEKEGLI